LLRGWRKLAMSKNRPSDSGESADSKYSLSATLDEYEVKEMTLARAAKALGEDRHELSRVSDDAAPSATEDR